MIGREPVGKPGQHGLVRITTARGNPSASRNGAASGGIAGRTGRPSACRTGPTSAPRRQAADATAPAPGARPSGRHAPCLRRRFPECGGDRDRCCPAGVPRHPRPHPPGRTPYRCSLPAAGRRPLQFLRRCPRCVPRPRVGQRGGGPGSGAAPGAAPLPSVTAGPVPSAGASAGSAVRAGRRRSMRAGVRGATVATIIARPFARHAGAGPASVSAEGSEVQCGGCASLSPARVSQMAAFRDRAVARPARGGHDVGRARECALSSWPSTGLVVDSDACSGFHIIPRADGFSTTPARFDRSARPVDAQSLVVDRAAVPTVVRSGVERSHRSARRMAPLARSRRRPAGGRPGPRVTHRKVESLPYD